MKTFIKAPKKTEIFKLPSGLLQEEPEELLEQLKESVLCAPFQTIAESLGCNGKEPLNPLLCNLIDSFLESFSCSELTPEKECEKDSDCGDYEICSKGECIDDPDDCRSGLSCEDWERCNVNNGSCDDNYDHCHFTGCTYNTQVWGECNEESGECEPFFGRCKEDLHCTWETGINRCDLPNTLCVECLTNEDCEGGEICYENNACAPL